MARTINVGSGFFWCVGFYVMRKLTRDCSCPHAEDWLTACAACDKFPSSMKCWRWTLLVFELFLFALILVLPQVDLPDFTFHGGTAPVVAKAKVCSPPVMSSIATPGHTRLPQPFVESGTDTVRPATPLKPHTLLSLLCTLLC
jgi:hypothetical protein